MNAVAAGSSSTTMRRPGRNWPPRSGRCDHISRYCRGAGARARGDGWHAEFWSMTRSPQMPASNGATAADAGTVDVGGDLTVNRLGFGAMRVTGRGIWGDPPDRNQARAVLRRAVELGVNFIDTADSYGPKVSEELIAQVLRPYPDDLDVATKVDSYSRVSGNDWPSRSGGQLESEGYRAIA